MERLLESEYKDYATIFRYEDDLELAMRLGYPGEEVINLTRDDLRRWIETKQSAMTNVIDLCDWRSPNDEDGHTE